MNYKKNLKIIIGSFLILCSIMGLFQTFSWLITKKNYNKEYVYSDLGNLYYEKNEEKIYIKKIYNTNGETLQLNVPDKKTIIMYCYKDKPTEGIYLGINNTADSRLQYPVVNICISLFILAVAIFILCSKNEDNAIKNFYIFYVLIFTIGIILSAYEISNVISYFSIKNNDNIVNATIYSDIYETGNNSERYKAVSYYYVNGNKYVFVDEAFKYGNIDDVLGTTKRLYYNTNKPEKSLEKISIWKIISLIIGILITIISFPFVFFVNKMSERYNRAIETN